ncbi:MAG: dihydroxy-acid dehydratase [Lutisporaceae bacterium]
MKMYYTHAESIRVAALTTMISAAPIIGIANAFSDIVPGHFHLRQVADFVKKGVYRAGGNAVEFGVIGCCDSVGNGSFDGMHYILPSREIIADSIEINGQGSQAGWPCYVGFLR